MAISNARNGYINGATSGWVAESVFYMPNGNTYALLLNTSSVVLDMYRVDYSNLSLTLLDGSNSPSHSGATHSYTGAKQISGSSTDYIYAGRRSATNTARVRRFDTITETWESTDIGSADASTVAHSDFNIRLAIRSDDDVILGYRDSGTNDTAYRVYEGSSWAAAVNVHTTNTSVLLDVRMTENSDMAHFLFYEQTANDLTTRSLDNTNGLGTVTDLDASANTATQYGNFMAYVNDGGTHRIAALVPDSGGENDFAYSTSSSAPTFSITSAVSPTSVSDPGPMGGIAVPFQNRYHVIWSGDARGSIHADVMDDYATPGAATTDRDVVTGLANDPAFHAAAAPTGIIIAYTDHTTPSVGFAWAWGGPPPAIITVVETITDTTTSAGTGHTVTKSASLADGDVVYIFLAMNGGTLTSGPTGFTQVASETTQSNPKCFVHRKVITSAAGEGSWDYVTSSVTKSTISVTLRGVDNTTPEDATITQATNSTGSNAMTVAEVTTVTDDALLLYSSMLNSTTADLYEPETMAVLAEVTGSGKRQALTWEARTTAGGTGSRTGRSSSSTLAWGAFMVAVRPDDGSVDATGTVTGSSIVVAGGSVTATAGTGATGTVTGSTIVVSGGSVTGTFPVDDTGTVTGSTIAVTGASVTGTAGTSATGTVTGSTIVVSGGSVSATAGTGDTGTVSAGTIVVTGGTVTGTGDTSEDATGTVTGSTIAITGGSVTGAAGAAGDVTGSTIAVTGGSVSATAGTSATGSVTVGTITIIGGTVTATAGQAAEAVVTGSTVVISGGTVTATDTNQNYGEIEAYVNLRHTLTASMNLRETVAGSVALAQTVAADVNLTPTIEANVNLAQTISGSLDLNHTN